MSVDDLVLIRGIHQTSIAFTESSRMTTAGHWSPSASPLDSGLRYFASSPLPCLLSGVYISFPLKLGFFNFTKKDLAVGSKRDCWMAGALNLLPVRGDEHT